VHETQSGDDTGEIELLDAEEREPEPGLRPREDRQIAAEVARDVGKHRRRLETAVADAALAQLGIPVVLTRVCSAEKAHAHRERAAASRDVVQKRTGRCRVRAEERVVRRRSSGVERRDVPALGLQRPRLLQNLRCDVAGGERCRVGRDGGKREPGLGGGGFIERGQVAAVVVADFLALMIVAVTGEIICIRSCVRQWGVQTQGVAAVAEAETKAQQPQTLMALTGGAGCTGPGGARGAPDRERSHFTAADDMPALRCRESADSRQSGARADAGKLVAAGDDGVDETALDVAPARIALPLLHIGKTKTKLRRQRKTRKKLTAMNVM